MQAMAPPYEPEALLAQGARVRALARRLVFDEELAQEIEQEAWLAALTYAPRGVADPRAWLASLVRHALGRARRRAARREELEQAAACAREPRGDDPAALAERAEALRLLLAAVERLPEAVRRAIVLHHLDGLSLPEVARRTEAPLETVRSRVKRGLGLLRGELARGRRNDAWALFLVRGFELAPPSLARGLALVARDSLLSLLLMGTTGKFVLSATALALLVGFLLVQRAPTERTHDAAVAPASTAAELAPGEPRARADAARVAPRAAEVQPGRRDAARLEPRASARTGTLVLDVRWGDDGTPAGGVEVRVSAADVAGSGTWGTTSADGRLELEVAPGFVTASCIHGGLSATEVAVGERSELELEIPPGIRVLGRVEDGTGAPVADAELFLSLGVGEDAFEGRVVARADERGAFTLRSAPVGLGVCLSARAAGFAPSEQVVLSAPSDSELAVRLVLDQAGRALAGRVLDPEDAPVAGASVLVGSEYEWELRHRPDGSRVYPPIGEHVTTDASGRFALRGVPRGAVAVRVRAAGHPVFEGELAEDAPGELTIRLARGARVLGTVRTEDGTPLAGIRVRRAGNGSFAVSATTSAEDGTYVLEPLAPGAHVLVVERPASGPGWLQAEPAARLELELAPGEERRFDPRLAPARVLRGRIEAPGQELEGWTVRGWSERNYVEEVRTDAEGRFALTHPPAGEIGLHLFARGGSPLPLASVEHVPVDGPEVVLRPDPALCGGKVRGRMRDAKGLPVRSADVLASHPQFGTTLVHPSGEDGRFELGPLPAGEWTLALDPLVPGWAVARHTLAIGAGEERDLGEFVLGPGGTLVLSVAADSPALHGLDVVVADLEGRAHAWLTLGREPARSRALVPGSYRLALPAPAAGARPVELVIVAEQETALTLALPVLR